jgi:hypothetical protein
MLKLGKELNRCYNIRIPFLNYHYIISIFYNTSSNFLLFKVENPNNEHFDEDNVTHGIKINMFKNLRASKFCSTFLNLHNYRNENLDIVCQYDSIQDFYHSEVTLISNENIILNKIKSDDGNKIFNDSLSIYSFTFPSYYNEFIFIIAERQHIVKKIKKKIVRSTALQIATTQSLNFLGQMNQIDDKQGSPLVLHI